MKKDSGMKNKVMAYCRQKELLRCGDRVLVGLSGGADSVCLFLVLLELSKELGLTLFPVHIHHGIRGEEADRDVRFCAELCEKHGLILEIHCFDVPALAKEQGWTLEEAGRNVRYEVFQNYLLEGRCDRIAVAHHKNDQAETVLFQLFRGSRLKGLSGMSAKNGDVIRPLLSVTREEIEDYLREKGQDYCIDSTNFEEEYTRNVIRNQILPAAEGLQSAVVDHIADTAGYLGRVETFLEGFTDALYKSSVTEENAPERRLRISAGKLREADPLIAERVLYRVLCVAAGQKKDISAVYVKDCMELLTKQTGKQLTLPYGITVKKSYGELVIVKKGSNTDPKPFYEEILRFPYEAKLPDGRIFRLFLEKNTKKSDQIPKSHCTKWFDYDKIVGIVTLRTVRQEDRMVLFADGRGKSGMEVLKNAKVPREARDGVPVLAEGDRLLWIFDIRGSEGYRVTEETKQILVAEIEEK